MTANEVSKPFYMISQARTHGSEATGLVLRERGRWSHKGVPQPEPQSHIKGQHQNQRAASPNQRAVFLIGLVHKQRPYFFS
jgi:hypothetical protein